jgi:CheY-like chemotaxis protein
MSRRLLLVDDEADFCEVLRTILEGAGYEVVVARNGREALGAFLESLANKKLISLVLLDISMPGLNGLEVLEIIREEEKLRDLIEVPIVMLTAYDKPWMDPSLIKGSTDYILKSASNEELLKKIEDKLK